MKVTRALCVFCSISANRGYYPSIGWLWCLEKYKKKKKDPKRFGFECRLSGLNGSWPTKLLYPSLMNSVDSCIIVSFTTSRNPRKDILCFSNSFFVKKKFLQRFNYSSRPPNLPWAEAKADTLTCVLKTLWALNYTYLLNSGATFSLLNRDSNLLKKKKVLAQFFFFTLSDCIDVFLDLSKEIKYKFTSFFVLRDEWIFSMSSVRRGIPGRGCHHYWLEIIVSS